MLPAYDPQATYQVSTAEDGFVAISATNLSPCKTERPGIFVTGTAAGPMDIVDSVVMAGAAAAEAASYIEMSKNGPPLRVDLGKKWEAIHV